MKFKYNEEVEVTSGFYEGKKGKIKNYSRWGFRYKVKICLIEPTSISSGSYVAPNVAPGQYLVSNGATIIPYTYSSNSSVGSITSSISTYGGEYDTMYFWKWELKHYLTPSQEFDEKLKKVTK